MCHSTMRLADAIFGRPPIALKNMLRCLNMELQRFTGVTSKLT
jgi:hypothetical protein